MTSRTFFWIGLLLMACQVGVFAASGGDLNASGSLGLGMELGQPIGATGKLWLSNISAVDAGLGYHFNHNFDVHADFLVHSFALGHIGDGDLPLYAGLGARVLVGDDTQFGLRIPLGAAYFLRPNRVELFAEIAPVIDLSNIGGDVDGLVGIRIYGF